ncbi:adapter protein MecA 1/2 [Melghiribacillus thermohalophilus]|uniref:Adapter protein MecA n=1 Tax=Melghiribacillus thermohalophilus TaxID=1324956 RepID=A0A4R3N075_9BACI|nr:adaptor protein MecA [Melghiribacillus thermohalophilus]TCT22410.1 adapter protein MecA 1/2 [Melghiribacillus thermohalophilus]
MEIERINENTLKFYISYMDIEDRGFDRDEIWYNREKSEQLFWEMMDEVNDQEDFTIDGPLWIQVQALDKGLEIVVTKAQMSKDGQKLELPQEDGKTIEMPVDDKIEALLEQKFQSKKDTEEQVDMHPDLENELSFIVRFEDIEDAIQLSHSVESNYPFQDRLFHFEDSYYLCIQFDDENMDDEEQENILSLVLEFGEETGITIFRLQEYGKIIFADHALEQIKHYFQ